MVFKDVHETEPVVFQDMTIEWFILEALKAKEMGMNRWATRTDKRVDPPEVSLVFFKNIRRCSQDET